LYRVLNSTTIQILIWKREIVIIWPASGQDLRGNEKLQQLQSLPLRNLQDKDRSGHATNADKIIAKGVIGGNFARIRVQIVTEDHVRVEAVPKRMLNTGSVGQKLAMNSYQGIKPIFALELDNWS
jgi:hypothetical protein